MKSLPQVIWEKVLNYLKIEDAILLTSTNKYLQNLITYQIRFFSKAQTEKLLFHGQYKDSILLYSFSERKIQFVQLNSTHSQIYKKSKSCIVDQFLFLISEPNKIYSLNISPNEYQKPIQSQGYFKENCDGKLVEKTSLLNPVSKFQVCRVGMKEIFCADGSKYKFAQIFDIYQNKWKVLKPMLKHKKHNSNLMGCTCLNGKILYVCEANIPTNFIIQSFDFETEWKKMKFNLDSDNLKIASHPQLTFFQNSKNSLLLSRPGNLVKSISQTHIKIDVNLKTMYLIFSGPLVDIKELEKSDRNRKYKRPDRKQNVKRKLIKRQNREFAIGLVQKDSYIFFDKNYKGWVNEPLPNIFFT